MTRLLAAVALLAATSFAFTGCATPATTASAIDWNRPFTENTKPVTFSHDMAIANPPYPAPKYGNYWEEPTRFEFHPRNVTYDESDDPNIGSNQGTDEGTTEEQNPVVNGIMYVDPNQ